MKDSLWLGDAPGGNYVKKVERLWAKKKIPEGKFSDLTIRHDDWCAMLQTNGKEPCNCDPDIEVRTH